MHAVLVALHIIVCFFLIAVVLIQRGKGAEVGAVFGGGASSTIFGSRGAGNFLTKLTTGSAIVFMCTSLTLSYLATDDSASQLFQDGVEEEAALEEPLFEQLGTVDPEATDEAGAALAEEGSATPGEPRDDASPETPAGGGDPQQP
jgi:preprotein translocase subunit SecG